MAAHQRLAGRLTMRVDIGDIRLFVEVCGPKLVAAERGLSVRTTIVMLHGGPAWDQRTLLSDLGPLGDVAQLIC